MKNKGEMFPEISQFVDEIVARVDVTAGPMVVAIDGRSGCGKSTLARALVERLQGTCIQGDDFYCGGVGLRPETPQELAADCIDWRAQRAVFTLLKQGDAATFHAFDWAAFDGSKRDVVTEILPAKLVVLEGVYSGRVELRELVDFSILLTLPEGERLRRLVKREGGISDWEAQWHRAEDWYFANDARPEAFDMVLGLGD